MRNSLCLTAVLACWIVPATAVEVPISSVVLYPGSATVERSVQVAPGTKELEVSGVPANFDVQTLRVQADQGIQVGQVILREIGRTESASAREAELEARIQSLQDRIGMIDVDAKSAALVEKYLENLGSPGASTERQQPVVDARSIAAMLDAMRRGGSDAFERMHKAELQKRELNKQVAALQRDLDKLRSGARDARNIVVQLAVHQPGSVKVSYQVNRAGWKPAYRALLDVSASSVDLERMATISQKTGEDWSGVKLKLSTGQPRLSPRAPEPQPWLLSYQKASPADARVYAAAAPAPMMAIAGAQPRRNKAIDEADNYVAPVVETQGSFSTEFDVPARVTLPADGREVSVALSRQPIAVKQRVRTAPRLEKAAVVVAEATRPEGVWLPGQVQLYRDGSYMGSTHWNPQESDKFMFPFGRDDLIRVAVERGKELSGSGGLLLTQAQRKVADVYVVTSHHQSPVDLLVLEASPVSTSEEVKVYAQFDPKPGIEAWEQRRGVVGWETSIAPRQTLKFHVDYTVNYPKDGIVTGLP